MILTVADLLHKIKEKELDVIKEFTDIKHPGLIGDMYEGLSKDILEKAMFTGLDVRVSSGKIRNSLKEYSDEIDCMIVIGEGLKIPHTDKYIYESDKVIAVIQIKKNLFSKEIEHSYKNLLSIVNVTEFRDGEKYHTLLQRDAFRSICREELPHREEVHLLSKEKQMIYHTLLLEAFYPARIAWGYNGFKSELSLREGFTEYLNENVSTEETRKKGFSPLKFPNLIISDKYSLVKANGMPFACPMAGDWWPFYMSTSENPVYLLLQIIWTRIQYMYKLSAEIYGDDDLILNQMHGFLCARYIEKYQAGGWQIEKINATHEQLNHPIKNSEWQPVFINKTQLKIFRLLVNNDVINYEGSKEIRDIIENDGYNFSEFITNLVKTGLISAANGKLELITVKCICGILPDGRIYAGDDKTGTVTKWVMRFLDSWHSEKTNS